jgi:surface protein
MSNTIGWGKGATNNSIGWGQSGNNSIGFGSVYATSNAGETDLGIIDPPTYFGILVDTSITGTGTVSNNDQFQFTGALGNYDVEAYQNGSLVATFEDLSGEETITLPSAGVYELRVEPKEVNGFNRIQFNNVGDRNKLFEIKSWGSNVVWVSFANSFRGCQNLGECNIVDVPNLSQVTNFSFMFASAPNFNSDLSNWDVSNGTNFSFMFIGASSFNSDLSQWDVSNGTNFSFMFSGASSFTSDLSQWDVSNGTNFTTMFFNASSFNSDLSNWDVSNGTSFSTMLRNASSFNSDLSNWDVSNGTSLVNFLLGSNINEPNTTTNYDNLLNAWSELSLNLNISFSGGNSQYSAVGLVGRNKLINDFGWTIADGGLAT